MKKESRHIPSYKLVKAGDKHPLGDVSFVYQDTVFVSHFPMFGMTETQKVALQWASRKNTAPVTSVSHERPGKADGGPFWPNDLHQTYYPYSMVIARLELLGQSESQLVKIYFCDIVTHVSDHTGTHHAEGKGVYVVPV